MVHIKLVRFSGRDSVSPGPDQLTISRRLGSADSWSSEKRSSAVLTPILIDRSRPGTGTGTVPASSTRCTVATSSTTKTTVSTSTRQDLSGSNDVNQSKTQPSQTSEKSKVSLEPVSQSDTRPEPEQSPPSGSRTTGSSSPVVESRVAKLENYRTWQEDKQRAQVYSVGAFRATHSSDNTEDNGESSPTDTVASGNRGTKRYVLNPSHAAHRDRQNREKFELITARFKVELDKAQGSWNKKVVNTPSFTTQEHIQDYQLQRHVERVLGKPTEDSTEQQSETVQSPQEESCSCAQDYSTRVKFHQREIDLSPKSAFTAVVTEPTYSGNSSQPHHSVQTTLYRSSPVTYTSTTNPLFSPSNTQQPPVTMTTTAESIYASPRLAEKQELIALNSRLHQYIRHIREMKEDQGYLDSRVFLESVTVLEEELLKLKSMYEQELDHARIQIDDICRAKKHFEMEEKKAKALASELKNRLEVEAQRNNRYSVEINSLQRALAQKELMVEEGRIALVTPTHDLEKLTVMHQKMLREHEDLKKRFEKEQLARQDAEDRFDTQHKKMAFQNQIYEQERAEMQERLESANRTILALEEKLREMSHHDQTLVDMLKRVRASAEDELRNYQDESEERHDRHLTELKAQIEEDDKRITELTNETIRLNKQITELLGQNRQLEGQNVSLEHQKGGYVKMLEDEKIRAAAHVRKMEQKLREMQEVLISKMRELNAARESQVPLKAEIDSFKSLIEEEERRLRLGPGEFPELPSLPQAYRREPAAPAAGPTLVPQPIGYGSRPVLPSAHGHQDLNPQPRPLGPVRIKSAPAPTLRQRSLNQVPSNMGQGKDYFEEMFKDLKIQDTIKESPRSVSVLGSRSSSTQVLQPSPRRLSSLPVKSPSPEILKIPETEESVDGSVDVNEQAPSPMGMVPVPPPMAKSPSPVQAEERSRPVTAGSLPNTSTYETHPNACSVGDLKILEVHSEGRYVRLVNAGQLRDEEIGGYTIQQNVGGHPVAVFRFPPRTRLLAAEVVTVWAGCTDPSAHRPPSDFVFKEQQKWGTGPECVTIICKPNGQAVAWQTGVHRLSRDAYTEGSAHNTSMAYRGQSDPNCNANNNNKGEKPEMASAEEQLATYNMNVNAPPGEPQYLRRQKEQPPSLAAPKHPHGAGPLSSTHPTSGQHRAQTYGNDNSSVNRQSRVQSQRPDPIPGAPYAGAAAQRMGSASLRRFQPTGSGALANKAGEPGVTSQPPNSFQTPHNRFQSGLEQIQSQHHADFNPPMPRPPLFSTW